MEWDRWAAQRAGKERAAGESEEASGQQRMQAARMRRWIQRRAARAEAESRDPGASFDAATRGAKSEVPYRGEMERAFNQSFAGVQVHLGQKEPMAELGAHAATEGQSVAFAEPQPDRALVAHELTHVVQNRSYPGGDAIQRSAEVSQPGEDAEREADANAERVAAGGQAQVSAAPSAAISRFGESEGELRVRLEKLEQGLMSMLSSEGYAQLAQLVDQLLALKQLAHENNFGSLANQIGGRMSDWSGQLAKVEAEKWPKEERQPVEAKLGAIAHAQATYNTLGKDKWREFIDGKDAEHGSSCYDDGLNGGGVDKGWLESEKEADRFVGERIGQHLDLEGYARIHDLAVQHSNKHEGFRGEHNDIGVPTRENNRDPSAIDEMGPEPTVDILGKADSRGIYRAEHKPMPRAEVQGRVQEALDEYYLNIGRAHTRPDKLRVITQVHQKLERLHAFMDGTGRADHFVLNKFLVENGFSPVIIADQNEVNHSTAATWQKHIEDGMGAWLACAEAERMEPTREEYDAERRQAYLMGQLITTEDPRPGAPCRRSASSARSARNGSSRASPRPPLRRRKASRCRPRSANKRSRRRCIR